jgi:hypothetical protein
MDEKPPNPSDSKPALDRRSKSIKNRYEAERLKKKWGVAAVQVRYREIGNWYALLKRFPAALFDRNGYILFPTEEAYRTAPGILIGKEIGFRKQKGISEMPGYKRFPTDEPGDGTLITDIKQIESNKATDPTTKQALVSARIGQGKFGSDVREQWNNRCCVTGSSTAAVLEASHIKRWADSNDKERLDPNNGLLLIANLHKLFDAGLISFNDSGKLLVSSELSPSEQEIFGVIGKKLSKKPSAETANYLSYHRTKFWE